MDDSTDLGPAVGGRPSQDFFLSATLTMVPEPGEWVTGIEQDPTYGADVSFNEVVPEPGTLVLLISGGLGLLLLVWLRRRRR